MATVVSKKVTWVRFLSQSDLTKSSMLLSFLQTSRVQQMQMTRQCNPHARLGLPKRGKPTRTNSFGSKDEDREIEEGGQLGWSHKKRRAEISAIC